MHTPIHIEQVAPVLTAVIRSQARSSELSRVVPTHCGEVWEFARAAGLPRPGRHVALYLDGTINLEVGVEVTAPFTGSDRVRQSSTPAGSVATAAHIGPYTNLGVTHRAIVDWCKEGGHRFAGPSWEIYGHWTDDPARLRTDVYYLLAAGGNDPRS